MLPHEEAVEKYKAAVRFGPDFIDACTVSFALMALGSKAKETEELKSGVLS
jgi:hypothetical protein